MNERVFLKADWKYLTLFNYRVADSVLLPFLPAGCELDHYDGSAHVSLVAFHFLNTRVFGIPWPGFVNFPEINLRFYVKHNGQRGVCFIREYVPSQIVAGLARVFYNEPYKAVPMKQSILRSNGELTARYELKDGDANLKIEVTGDDAGIHMPKESSCEHFFKEHELGMGKDRKGRTVLYKVWHPKWNVFPIKKSTVSLDWEKIYGSSFAFLADQKPDSMCFAEGSEIKVYFLTAN